MTRHPRGPRPPWCPHRFPCFRAGWCASGSRLRRSCRLSAPAPSLCSSRPRRPGRRLWGRTRRPLRWRGPPSTILMSALASARSRRFGRRFLRAGRGGRTHRPPPRRWLLLLGSCLGSPPRPWRSRFVFPGRGFPGSWRRSAAAWSGPETARCGGRRRWFRTRGAPAIIAATLASCSRLASWGRVTGPPGLSK
jgi:hypothetical protein